MLPLLLKDGLIMAHIALSGAFFLMAVLAWQYIFTPASTIDPPPSTIAEIRRDKERRDREGLLEALTGVVVSTL